jgi:GT2 family glycosyltransferase
MKIVNEQVERLSMHLPLVSIVVCTLNRKDSLNECLAHLVKIAYPESRYEILVVDGGSTDGTKDLVKKNFPNVRFIVDERKGVSYARNTGAENTRGEIVVYTDDDCIVGKDWLRNLIAEFSNPKIGAVGGPVRLLHPEKIPRRFLVRTALGVYDLGESVRTTRNVRKLITANMAVRREVFHKINFDTELGREGKALFALEDIDFCESLLEHGYGLLYTPDALVYHNINVSRVNMKYLMMSAIYGGVSLYFMKKKRAKSRINLFASLLRYMPGNLLLFLQNRTTENLCFLIGKIVACFAFLKDISNWSVVRITDH